MSLILSFDLVYPAAKWQFITVNGEESIFIKRIMTPLLPREPLNPVFI